MYLLLMNESLTLLSEGPYHVLLMNENLTLLREGPYHVFTHE